jgi:broad specificity phosphatase PhoE
MYEITFLRHGESTGNAEGYFQGQSDEYPLSKKGKEQSRALAARWKREKIYFNKIISSPLLRAKQTAEIINEILMCPLEFDPIWMERDNGNLTGTKRGAEGKPNLRPDFINLYDPIGETGESEWELFLRGGKALQSIFHRSPGKYLIVSHGGILNKVIHTICGIKPLANFKGVRFQFSNTGFTKVTYSLKDNRYRVFSVNNRSHIDKDESIQWPYHLTLLRHGETEGNAQQIFQGQADFPLNSVGRDQAKALSNYWAENQVRFEKIITSPLLRAYETAEIIAKDLGLPVEENVLLKEVNNGKFAGLNIQKINELHPNREDRINPFTPVGGTGETWFDLYLRAGRLLQYLMDNPPGRYLIVSHGGTINSLLWTALGVVPGVPHRNPTFHLENTGYAILGYNPKDNRWQLVNAGDQRHLKGSHS